VHNYLLKLSNTSEPLVEYVFRPLGPKRSTASNYDLTGYGVALDLKKMDYLALDDRNQGVYSTVIHFLVLIL
jgi:UDP-glucose:glycoprotein glucosyltransferase